VVVVVGFVVLDEVVVGAVVGAALVVGVGAAVEVVTASPLEHAATRRRAVRAENRFMG
jgi:hypothetical protein